MTIINCDTEIISTDPKESATNIMENYYIVLCGAVVEGKKKPLNSLLSSGCLLPRSAQLSSDTLWWETSDSQQHGAFRRQQEAESPAQASACEAGDKSKGGPCMTTTGAKMPNPLRVT